MKRFLIIAAVISVIFSGCRDTYPYADFYVNSIYIEPNENINFRNISEDATSYFWDFGDGYTSSVFSPTHFFSAEGVYTVTLTATSKDGHTDRTTMNIEVFYTEIEITVAEWNYDYVIDFIVPDAFVILYPTYNDWVYNTNRIAEGYSDGNGIINFWGLQSGRRYYVYVENEYYDNLDLGLDYPEDVTTLILQHARLTYFTAWADYFGPLKRAKAPRENNIQRPKIKRGESALSTTDASK